MIKLFLIISLLFSFASCTKSTSLPRNSIVLLNGFQDKSAKMTFRQFPVYHSAILTPEEINQWIAFLNEKNYFDEYPKPCFEPIAGIQINTDQIPKLEILISLDCSHILFYEGNKKTKRGLSPWGQEKAKLLIYQKFSGTLK